MEEPSEIGDWIRVNELGSGAFGIVKLWKNKSSNDFIAVKKCRLALTSHISKRQKERWCSEVQMIENMKNENVVSHKKLPEVLEKTLTKYNPTKLPLLSMEYCSKGNLRTSLNRPGNAKGLKEVEVRYILQDMGNAVSYLHSLNVTHRDIKPENIVLQESNGRPTKTVYKLIDLGYAKELGTAGASFVGTLHYVAPEIFKAERYTNNVDYWSLGIVAFEIMTGVHPFLHHLSPVQRFPYIEKKSPEDICILMTRNGNIKYLKEVFLETHVTHVFKKQMESWLKLVLQYDHKMRGVSGNEQKNVFEELRNILNRKIVKVFSVWNYKYFSYEIRDSTTISEMKTLIAREMEIAHDDQFLLYEKILCKFDDDSQLTNCFSEINQDTTLYVFKKGGHLKEETIALPEVVKYMFENGQKEINPRSLKPLYANVVYFISQENKLLTAIKTAFYLQMEHMKFLIQQETELFVALRDISLKLMTEIEYCYKINHKFLERLEIQNERSLSYVTLYRKYLRQCKELVENVNSLTARHLNLRGNDDRLKSATEKLKSFLNDADAKLCECALKSYEAYERDPRIMIKNVSDVIKIKCEVIKSEILKDYVFASWKFMRKLEKLIVWIKALQTEIKEVSSCMCDNESKKYGAVCDNTSKVARHEQYRISFPMESSQSFVETERIIKENSLLRYNMQDVINAGLAYHRHIVQDLELKYHIESWNGVTQEDSSLNLSTRYT